MASNPIIEHVTGSVTTTTDVTTTVVTFDASGAERGYLVAARFVGHNTGANEGYGRMHYEAIRNDGGTLTSIGSSATTAKADDAKWVTIITISGTNILLRVKGDNADTIDWAVSAKILVTQA